MEVVCMKYAILFSSRSGNTREIAEAIRQALPKEECVSFEHNQKEALAADLVFVGSWTDKGSFDEDMISLLKGMHHKKIALFGTAGFGGSPAYFEEILKRVNDIIPSDNHIIDSFMCQGRMPIAVRNRYEGMLNQHPEDEKIQAFLSNFDQARTHPDAQDIQNVKAFAKKVYHQNT